MAEFTRRQMIKGASAGTVLLTLPNFLAACGRGKAAAVHAPTAPPANPFMEWFGIDEATVRRVMAVLTSRGANHADLYFQHTRANSIRMEDGIISQASSSIDQGVGLRVVVGDQVGYAFTEDLTEEAMKAAAQTASAIAAGSAATRPGRSSTAPRPPGSTRSRFRGPRSASTGSCRCCSAPRSWRAPPTRRSRRSPSTSRTPPSGS